MDLPGEIGKSIRMSLGLPWATELWSEDQVSDHCRCPGVWWGLIAPFGNWQPNFWRILIRRNTSSCLNWIVYKHFLIEPSVFFQWINALVHTIDMYHNSIFTPCNICGFRHCYHTCAEKRLKTMNLHPCRHLSAAESVGWYIDSG